MKFYGDRTVYRDIISRTGEFQGESADKTHKTATRVISIAYGNLQTKHTQTLHELHHSTTTDYMVMYHTLYA